VESQDENENDDDNNSDIDDEQSGVHTQPID